MRFAYIDSQGNEVTIPSVDALALRIELGAIGPETELYDAQADRWGPAHSHEIFHSLSRDAGGEDFLVPAPPPSAEVEDESSDGTPPPPPPSDVSPPTSSLDALGLTLAPSAADAREDADDEESVPEDIHFDLVSADDAGPPASPPPTEDGGFGAGGLELEEPLFATGGGLDGPIEDPLDLEPPMSDFDPSSPPAWMEQDGPAGFSDPDGPVMDFSPEEDEAPIRAPSGWDDGGGVQDPVPPRAEAPPARKVPPRPPPRRSARRKTSATPFLLFLLVGAAAAAGWYAWQVYVERPAAAPPRPAVVIPEIPAELEDTMHGLAREAIALMYREIEGRAFPPDEPRAPSDEWLAGVYLGQASRFDQVEAFWSATAGFADRLRDEEIQAFHGAYLSLAEAGDHDDGTRAMLVERADSGFMATREARLQVYDRLDALAGAALALHDFLRTHESEIVYTPARTFAGNPIEEAVPATAALGDEMWDLVEDITNALDALGTLDRVTLERLSTVLFERVQSIGIR